LGPCKGIKISNNILFVNDLLLFYDGSRREAIKIRDLLYLYYATTSMLINVQKSSTSFLGLVEEEVRYFTQLFPF
jgi:hypothetical protein